jgi:hypothetical protein
MPTTCTHTAGGHVNGTAIEVARCTAHVDTFLVVTVAIQEIRLLHLTLKSTVHIFHKSLCCHCNQKLFLLTPLVYAGNGSCRQRKYAGNSRLGLPALFLLSMISWKRGCDCLLTKKREPSTSLRLYAWKMGARERCLLQPKCVQHNLDTRVR